MGAVPLKAAKRSRLAIGDSVFALVEWLEPQAEQVFAWLAAEQHLLNRPRDTFIEGVSRLLSDLNALHPFRESNGRTQRAFLRLLAADAGWHLAWSDVDSNENAAISAAAMADRRAFVPLFHRILRPSPDGPFPAAPRRRPKRGYATRVGPTRGEPRALPRVASRTPD